MSNPAAVFLTGYEAGKRHGEHELWHVAEGISAVVRKYGGPEMPIDYYTHYSDLGLSISGMSLQHQSPDDILKAIARQAVYTLVPRDVSHEVRSALDRRLPGDYYMSSKVPNLSWIEGQVETEIKKRKLRRGTAAYDAFLQETKARVMTAAREPAQDVIDEEERRNEKTRKTRAEYADKIRGALNFHEKRMDIAKALMRAMGDDVGPTAFEAWRQHKEKLESALAYVSPHPPATHGNIDDVVKGAMVAYEGLRDYINPPPVAKAGGKIRFIILEYPNVVHGYATGLTAEATLKRLLTGTRHWHRRSNFKAIPEGDAPPEMIEAANRSGKMNGNVPAEHESARAMFNKYSS